MDKQIAIQRFDMYEVSIIYFEDFQLVLMENYPTLSFSLLCLWDYL